MDRSNDILRVTAAQPTQKGVPRRLLTDKGSAYAGSSSDEEFLKSRLNFVSAFGVVIFTG
jgi:hypothetical protein